MKKLDILADLVKKGVNKMVDAELHGWPPVCPGIAYQPHRPETKPIEEKAEAEK